MKNSSQKIEQMSSAFLSSPLGTLKIESDGRAIRSISILNKSKRSQSEPQDPVLKNCVRQIQEYFEGKRRKFDFAFNPQGTEFQKKVWQAARKIEFGQTLAYSDLAEKIRKPKAVRAVGAALGENPVLLVIPCHRVLAKTKKLTGFRGGLTNKAKLLEFEGSSFHP